MTDRVANTQQRIRCERSQLSTTTLPFLHFIRTSLCFQQLTRRKMARWLLDQIFVVFVLVNIVSSSPTSLRIKRAVWIDKFTSRGQLDGAYSKSAMNTIASWSKKNVIGLDNQKLLVANIFFKLFNHLAKTDNNVNDNIPCLTLVFDKPGGEHEFKLIEGPCSSEDDNPQIETPVKNHPPVESTGFFPVDVDDEETRDTSYFVTSKMIDTKMSEWTNIKGVTIVTAFKKNVANDFYYKLMLQYYKSTDLGPQGEMFCQVYVFYNSSIGIREIIYLKCIGENN